MTNVIEDGPGAIEDGYQAYDSCTDQALEDAEGWLEDQLSGARRAGLSGKGATGVDLDHSR